MTAELVRGRTTRCPSPVWRSGSLATPVAAAAALSDDNGRIHGTEWVAHPGAPCSPAWRCRARRPPTTVSRWTWTP